MFGRLWRKPDKTGALERTNRVLLARVARLEAQLAHRRADELLSARDGLLPLPRPGSSGAKLLSRNRALQRRLQGLLAEREGVAQELLDASADAAAAGKTALAQSLRRRAAAIRDAQQVTPLEVEAVGPADFDGGVVAQSWATVQATGRFADDVSTRVVALEPRCGRVHLTRAWCDDVVIAAVTRGAQAAADLIRAEWPDVSEDRYAVAAEAVLYGLAASLGSRWTESVRGAWCGAIDAVARSLGLSGMSGAVLFTAEDSSDTVCT